MFLKNHLVKAKLSSFYHTIHAGQVHNWRAENLVKLRIFNHAQILKIKD